MGSSADISNAFIGSGTVPKQGMRDHITTVKGLWSQQEGYKQWREVQSQITANSVTPQIVFAIPTSPTPAEYAFHLRNVRPVTAAVDLLMRLDNGSSGATPVTGSAVGQSTASAGIVAFANSNADLTLTSAQTNSASGPSNGHVLINNSGVACDYNVVYATATGLTHRIGAYCVTGAAALLTTTTMTFLWSGAGNFLIGSRISLLTRDF